MSRGLLHRPTKLTLGSAVILCHVAVGFGALASCNATGQMRRATNIESGILKAPVGANSHVTLQKQDGAIVEFRLIPATGIWLAKHAVTASALSMGTRLWIRFKRSSGGERVATEVTDEASSAWRAALRKEILAVTVDHRDGDRLFTLSVGDGLSIIYTLTDTTVISRGGAPVPYTQIAPGQVWYVAPRSTSSALISVAAMADSRQGVEMLVARQRPSIRGRVAGIDIVHRSIRLAVVNGASMVFPLSPDCAATKSGAIFSLAGLAVGQEVTLHTKQGDSGARLVTRITVLAGRKARKTPSSNRVPKPRKVMSGPAH